MDFKRNKKWLQRGYYVKQRPLNESIVSWKFVIKCELLRTVKQRDDKVDNLTVPKEIFFKQTFYKYLK